MLMVIQENRTRTLVNAATARYQGSLPGGGAFASFVPQIVPDKVPNMFHVKQSILEVFELFFVFLCLFLVKSREGVDPP